MHSCTHVRVCACALHRVHARAAHSRASDPRAGSPGVSDFSRVSLSSAIDDVMLIFLAFDRALEYAFARSRPSPRLFYQNDTKMIKR